MDPSRTHHLKLLEPEPPSSRSRPAGVALLPCLSPASSSSFPDRSPGNFLPGTRATVGSGWRPTHRPADSWCLTQTQAPKGWISRLSTTALAKRFQLWNLGLFCNERHLAKRLKSNSFYPFTELQPNVFVLEYYLDTLWKGTLLFVVCLFLVSSGLLNQEHEQETWVFPAYGVGVGLWIMISSLPRRRLMLNHEIGMYTFSIQGHTVFQGPLHLLYVRLALSSDAYGKCFFQLVLCGHKLEPLVLVQLSDRYEVLGWGHFIGSIGLAFALESTVEWALLGPAGKPGGAQMEFLGRHIARKLNINYFDCLTTSYRHVVRHWPLGAALSPGIMQRKTGACDKSCQSDLNLDV